MKTLPANLVLEKNKVATASAWLILLDVNLNDQNDTVLRFVRNNENVTFGGNEYLAYNFELDATEQNNKGEIPTVTLKVSNVTMLLQPYMEALSGAVGSTVKLTVVNSAHLTENYSELEMLLEVIAANSNAQWIEFTLGTPNPLNRRFPLERYLALQCRWKFNDVVYKTGFECAYAGNALEDITLSGTNPVVITVTSHPFANDDVLKFDDIVGTVELNENSYIVTKINDNSFSLNNTNSSNFTAYVSGGLVGFAGCKRTLQDCRLRGNSVRFGGFTGIRSNTVRLV